MIGSLGHSCLVDCIECIEWALWCESGSLSEGAGVKSVELGWLGAVRLNWLDRLSALYSLGSVHAIRCCSVRHVPGWDVACKETEELWGGMQSFREDRCCRS